VPIFVGAVQDGSIFLNVVKLRQDNYDPSKYLTRLEEWKVEVEKAG